MRLLICLLLVSLFISCKNDEKIPDVSDIKIDVTTQRFEKEFFALDSNELENRLDPLLAKYPSFGEIFLNTILNADPRWGADTTATYVKGFLSAYRNIYDTSEKIFADFTPYEKEIKYALQFLKHYFPSYKFPNQIITYIGPLDGYGDVISEDAFLIGLHQHLGKDFSLYSSVNFQETYPVYISKRFEPDYIAINCMKNVIADMYPEKNEEASLAIQMIEKGKRLYLLKKLLPHYDEYKLIGYTEKQYKDCLKNESHIWDFFVQNNLLQVIDNNILKNYIGEGPKTQELGDESPGNIGSFCGWQMVRKYMKQHDTLSLPSLMSVNSEKIFQEVKYKP